MTQRELLENALNSWRKETPQIIEKKVYVVAFEHNGEIPNQDADVWTLSENPNDTGWVTDTGYPGYGLPKELAEKYAEAINQYDALIKIARAAQASMRCIPRTAWPFEYVDLYEALSALEPVEKKEKS